LEKLIEGAIKRDTKNLAQLIENFEAYGNEIVDISSLACSLTLTNDNDNEYSTNINESIQFIQMNRDYLSFLMKHIVNTAKLLCTESQKDELNIKNIDNLRSQWYATIELLKLSIDDVVSINDFLYVYENRILKTVHTCFESINSKNNINQIEIITSKRSDLKYLIKRVCQVVTDETAKYEPCDLIYKIFTIVKHLDKSVGNDIDNSLQKILDNKNIGDESLMNVYINEFADTSRSICDNIRTLRTIFIAISHEGVYLEDDQDDDDNETSTETTENESSERLAESIETNLEYFISFFSKNFDFILFQFFILLQI
jgi:hypothetical protein